MDCENCKRKEASVHYQQVINGKASEIHLCDKCAGEKGMIAFTGEHQAPFANLIAGFMDEEEQLAGKSAKVKLRCPRCGWSNVDFKKTGYLGCPFCYKTFNKSISPLLRRIHGNNKHIGKKPKKITFTEPIISAQNEPEETKMTGQERAAEPRNKFEELKNLKSGLELAVKEERYEDAAKLRDRIKAAEIELKEDN